ncbi:hypothetical protein [Myxacorys almedinensis]|uniref:Uncharacterized protein n=1 Tax=Myxacorys almedinensis A TaxID=2690445 RepID=A0A8J7Z267_9CYAN|nr:hypothetical protein [Myxacorys almedinensis]NDJ18674.1 hypothetical protein [Myxacorys almedinensis A]
MLDIVKKWPPEEVLLEFKRLFFYQIDSTGSGTIYAVYDLIFDNDETEFRNTLKRCCYILVNNWDATRHYKPIQQLIRLFEDSTLKHQTISPTLKRLQIWIESFRNSKDYQDLKLFASRYDEQQPTQTAWAHRYTSYLLVPQFVDLENPIEQREAARTLAKRLKDRFKFDLAMYIVRSQTAKSPEKAPKNPTELGENVLLLIKTIVAKRGQYSHANLANIFLQQTQDLSYQEFKNGLQKYLIFSVEKSAFAEIFQARLAEKLDTLYQDYDQEIISSALILRTCNRVIEYLTTENRQEPSSLFILLLSPGNPMTLVIVLLKLILICRNSRTHLEAKVAELIRYYENYPENECRWIVNFLEIFNVTFTIYAENVHYNLVKMDKSEPSTQKDLVLEDYRIFAQTKPIPALDNMAEREENLNSSDLSIADEA